MPTYEYACTSCSEHLEVVQSFRDDPLTTCPACSGSLRKVFSPIGVVFKGSGFYKTDSRGGASPSSRPASAEAGSSTGDGGSAAGTSSSGTSSSGTSSSGTSGSGGAASGSGSSGTGSSGGAASGSGSGSVAAAS